MTFKDSGREYVVGTCWILMFGLESIRIESNASILRMLSSRDRS